MNSIKEKRARFKVNRVNSMGRGDASVSVEMEFTEDEHSDVEDLQNAVYSTNNRISTNSESDSKYGKSFRYVFVFLMFRGNLLKFLILEVVCVLQM